MSHFSTVLFIACYHSLTPALPSRRPSAQTHAKPPSGRAVHGSAKPVCKTEPGMENPAGEQPVDSELLCISTWAFLIQKANHADTKEPKHLGNHCLFSIELAETSGHMCLCFLISCGKTSAFGCFWPFLMLPIIDVDITVLSTSFV